MPRKKKEVEEKEEEEEEKTEEKEEDEDKEEKEDKSEKSDDKSSEKESSDTSSSDGKDFFHPIDNLQEAGIGAGFILFQKPKKKTSNFTFCFLKLQK